MFAKTLALLGIATVLAVIPTAAADHYTEDCGALFGHDLAGVVDLNGLDECLATTELFAPQPLPGEAQQASPLAGIPAVVVDCIAVQPWSDLCAAVNGVTAPAPQGAECTLPVGERCLVGPSTDPAAENLLGLPAWERPPVDLGFLGLFEPVPEAGQGLVPALGLHCIAVYPYSSLCNVLP